MNGKCVSYGALTGEESAAAFIRTGVVDINDDDIVIVYSNGFTNYLKREDFAAQLLSFDIEQFNQYVRSVATLDYELYGKEKTVVILKK